MTLLETIRTIETVALQQATVHTVVENDVFKLNDMPDVKYGVFAFTQGQHTSTTDGGFTTYGFSLFYIDRLNEDRSNQIQIQSTGERTLRNILLILADEGIESSPYTIQPFNQRFADECAGVYCDVQLTVSNDGTCPDWVPAIPPQDIISQEELDKTLSKSTIRVDRYQDFTAEEQTRALANAGAGMVVLEGLPDGETITAELSSQLAACSAIVVKSAPSDGGSQLFRRVKSATVDGTQVTTFEALADEHSIYLVTIRVEGETLTATSTVETVSIGEDGSSSLPAGGTTGQVLTKTSDADGAVAWQDAAGGALPFKVAVIDFKGGRQVSLTDEEIEALDAASMLVVENSVYNNGGLQNGVVYPLVLSRSYQYPNNFYMWDNGTYPVFYADYQRSNKRIIVDSDKLPSTVLAAMEEATDDVAEAAAEEPAAKPSAK